MSKLWLMAVLIAVLLVGASGPGYAQTDAQPLVIFIQGSGLEPAAMTDTGPTGISGLAQIFRNLGAKVVYSDLRTPLPEQAQVVVLVGPVRTFGVPQIAYLWMYLANGHNLLFAFDPEGAFNGAGNVEAQVVRSGLSTLLEWDYGIAISDAFLAEPWFSVDTISTTLYNGMLTYPEAVQDPIVAPLAHYQVPIWAWGARHMEIEPLSIGSKGSPLLYTETAYGETAQAIFRTELGNPVDPLELNIGTDALGKLNVAVRAEQMGTGSRIVLVGDSEIFKNGFGLAQNGFTPFYPGNQIFAERTAAWLLELPEEQWPSLVPGFTWIAIDGNSSDWEQYADSVTTVPITDANIKGVQTFADRSYIYLLIEQATIPERVEVSFDLNADGSSDTTLITDLQQVSLLQPDGTEVTIADADVAVRDVIELRIPMRVASTRARLNEMCLNREGTTSCFEIPVEISKLRTFAPFDFGLVHKPLVTVYTDEAVFVRSEPDINSAEVAKVGNATTFAAIGRDSDGGWIRVENARYTGWIASSLLTPSGDMEWLPVIESAAE
ncbi:MAG TPA: SH3 domain-containing protein [Aggregatilineaceae bacterium]|nr:SH3 domain-containing protein [Aggregatilineaceae bacterium]